MNDPKGFRDESRVSRKTSVNLSFLKLDMLRVLFNKKPSSQTHKKKEESNSSKKANYSGNTILLDQYNWVSKGSSPNFASNNKSI